MRDFEVICGDIRQTAFQSELFRRLADPVLFVNLCSGIDTVKLRKWLQSQPAGYVDICESHQEDNTRGRLSDSMPYTNQACHGVRPHLICQGINPGMVEYIARKLMRQMAPGQSGFKITIFESDQLSLSDETKQPVVSWSPKDLIGEMLSPSMVYTAGRLVEAQTGPAQSVMTQWQGRIVPARLVGHEDIWNLGHLSSVSDARFLYALHPTAMEVLADRTRINTLRLPRKNEAIQGSEQIVVTVEHPPTGQFQARLWRTDHARIQQHYGINAVQFQTAASTLLSMMLMQHTEIGLRKGTFNASQLPLDNGGWAVMDTLMDRLGIDFKPVKADYVTCPDETIDCTIQRTLGYSG